MFDVNHFEHQAKFVGNRDSLSFALRIQNRGAMFELQFFRAAQRNFQAKSEIVRNMVAAYGNSTRVLNNTIRINDVVRRTATNINDECAKFFLFTTQQGKR